MSRTRCRWAAPMALASLMAVTACGSESGSGRPPAASSASPTGSVANSTPSLADPTNVAGTPQAAATAASYPSSADFASALAAVGVACSTPNTVTTGTFKAADAVECYSGTTQYFRLYYGSSFSPAVDINEDIVSFSDSTPAGASYAVRIGPNWSLLAAGTRGVGLLSSVKLPATNYAEGVGRRS